MGAAAIEAAPEKITAENVLKEVAEAVEVCTDHCFISFDGAGENTDECEMRPFFCYHASWLTIRCYLLRI